MLRPAAAGAQEGACALEEVHACEGEVIGWASLRPWERCQEAAMVCRELLSRYPEGEGPAEFWRHTESLATRAVEAEAGRLSYPSRRLRVEAGLALEQGTGEPFDVDRVADDLMRLGAWLCLDDQFIERATWIDGYAQAVAETVVGRVVPLYLGGAESDAAAFIERYLQPGPLLPSCWRARRQALTAVRSADVSIGVPLTELEGSEAWRLVLADRALARGEPGGAPALPPVRSIPHELIPWRQRLERQRFLEEARRRGELGTAGAMSTDIERLIALEQAALPESQALASSRQALRRLAGMAALRAALERTAGGGEWELGPAPNPLQPTLVALGESEEGRGLRVLSRWEERLTDDEVEQLVESLRMAPTLEPLFCDAALGRVLRLAAGDVEDTPLGQVLRWRTAAGLVRLVPETLPGDRRVALHDAWQTHAVCARHEDHERWRSAVAWLSSTRPAGAAQEPADRLELLAMGERLLRTRRVQAAWRALGGLCADLVSSGASEVGADSTWLIASERFDQARWTLYHRRAATGLHLMGGAALLGGGASVANFLHLSGSRAEFQTSEAIWTDYGGWITRAAVPLFVTGGVLHLVAALVSANGQRRPAADGLPPFVLRDGRCY